MATKKFSVTYYPNPDENFWLLGLKQLEKVKKFEKKLPVLFKKNAKIHDGKKLKTIP